MAGYNDLWRRLLRDVILNRSEGSPAKPLVDDGLSVFERGISRMGSFSVSMMTKES